MKRDKFDDILQQKLHDMEMDITPTSWEQLERRITLDERERAVEHPRRRSLAWWKYAVAAVIIITAGIGISRFGFDKFDETADISDLTEVAKHPSIVSYEEIAAAVSPSVTSSASNGRGLNSLFSSVQSIAVRDISSSATRTLDMDITDPNIIVRSGANNRGNNNATFTEREANQNSRNRNYNTSYYSRRLSDYYDEWPYDETSMRKQNNSWVASIYSGTLSQANGGTSLTAMSLSRLASYDAAIIEASYQNNKITLNGQKLKHRLPVTVGLNVRKEISDHISLQTGISYSFLESTAELDAQFRHEYRQKLHYLGIPLSVNYSVLKRNRFDLYVTGGIMMEKAISARATTSIYSGNTFNSRTTDNLGTKGLLWSANAGIGATYYFLNDIGIYLEVGGNYSLPNHDQPVSYKTANPWSANIKAGFAVRF